jgi:hypothetical protein
MQSRGFLAFEGGGGGGGGSAAGTGDPTAGGATRVAAAAAATAIEGGDQRGGNVGGFENVAEMLKVMKVRCVLYTGSHTTASAW